MADVVRYYTGVFSIFYGTQRDHLAIWRPGMPLGTVLERAVGSVLMVLTVNDPARYDPFAMPIVGGAVAAMLGLLGVPRLRTCQWGGPVFHSASMARSSPGIGYTGRFSVHVMPMTCALSVSAIAGVISHVRSHPSSRIAATSD